MTDTRELRGFDVLFLLLAGICGLGDVVTLVWPIFFWWLAVFGAGVSAAGYCCWTERGPGPDPLPKGCRRLGLLLLAGPVLAIPAGAVWIYVLMT